MCVCVFESEGRKCRWNTVCLRVKEGSVGGTLCVCVCV